MVQAFDRTATDFVLLLATILVYVGAEAPIGALSNGYSPSLPAPSICASTSVNHIIQTLPQQCFTTAWPGKTEEQAIAPESLPDGDNKSPLTVFNAGSNTAPMSATDGQPVPHTRSENSHQQPSENHGPDISPPTSAVKARLSPTAAVDDTSDGDSESPLDNANFLSFEEWKKRNLAKAGQSADNIGGAKSGAAEPRSRPGGINNALDSLGEDTEIELDFGGFVKPPAPGARHAGRTSLDEDDGPMGGIGGKKPGAQLSKAHSRNKDAGVTCKERSNYASFDCAATILKTNPECKSATSVLVENKDSYMLNTCSAENKFFIVELCDDILVDTVVLANFEFFSSMFRTFRVSVSDRYPVKLDKWRELGIFEAQNSRGIQAFLVEEPQIWARYLRIEFLAHYGLEYYCPVSLLRVHGTTMMEEFNHELKSSRGEEEADDEEQPEETPLTRDVATADVLKQESKNSLEQSTMTGASTADSLTTPTTEQDVAEEQIRHSSTLTPVELLGDITAWNNSPLAQMAVVFESGSNCLQVSSRNVAPTKSPTPTSAHVVSNEANKVRYALPSSTEANTHQTVPFTPVVSVNGHSSSVASSTSTVSDTSSASSMAPKYHTSPTHPSPPNPTTQESFFKSVHKRLQLLESNSTLSLQYIEDQSRILRDAFAKAEKRQLAKTNTFLHLLNSTVLNEVREFRTQYDQIWQSTVLELSSQRQQSQVEIAALSTRLTLLADELLFQKRIAILQFLLILLCLGLALFSRGSAGVDYLEHVVNKSSFNLSRYASHFDSPRGSPPSTRPPSRYGFFGRAASSLHRRSPSEESMGVAAAEEREGDKSPCIEYSPPTPTSSSGESGGGGSPEGSSGSSERMEVNGTGSGVVGGRDYVGRNGFLSPDSMGETSGVGRTAQVQGATDGVS
ncbi:MAG: hypothetical protein LQ338_000946 [Usnochroma carphineum]|nr:MAG: hypothetical protein LQ338_000946 [Usnochroma carphineum]